MLDTYRSVLSRPGALAFAGTGLVARLPVSMLGIGIVLLVVHWTGSYAVAGSVSACYVVANAGFAVVQGRLVDAVGQSRVLPVASIVYAAGLGGLMLAPAIGAPVAVAYACAAVSGAALPPIGSCVRARWAHVVDDAAERDTAFALEAVLDEVVFVIGPVVVVLLATGVHPLAGLGLALLVGLAGPLALALQHATSPPVVRRQDDDGRRPGLPWAVLAPVITAMAAVGVVFGSLEVVTIAVASEQGAEGWSGPLLAVFAVGSLVAGIVTGTITWRRGPAHRLAVGTAAMAALMLPLPVLSSLPLLGGWLFVCGLSVSPVLIAATSLVQQAASPGRLTEALGVVHAGLAGGVAAGAAVGGLAADRLGGSTAYVVPLGGAVLAALPSLASRRTRG